jgi:hypothetical protein
MSDNKGKVYNLRNPIYNIRNPNAPHQAIIQLRVDVYERDETGKCIPPLSVLEKSYTVLIGKDFEDLEGQVKSFLEVFENAKTEYEQSLS